MPRPTLDVYRRAEQVVGPGLGALAVELDMPVWVVQAFRKTLR